MKTLVAYFSASGRTEIYAKRIAEIIEADIFEIKPKEEYTLDDLNWMNNYSRSSLEAKDRKIMPEIKDRIENIKDYDKVFLGFPIWWYQAPNIILSFLEQYDFSNITIIPFATSGSSDYGKSNDDLCKFINCGIIKEGVVVSKMSDLEFKDWLQRNK